MLRVWIPKANGGGQHPLSIPTIKDRMVQTAVLIVINSVLDTDLSPRQYGFRSHIDAQIAIRRVHFSISKRFAREVVDADLSDYFSTIPRGKLMKCLARRITDSSVLGIITARSELRPNTLNTVPAI
ncbi:reverse transcriptase domain-containing protein [Escherichia coli]